MAEWVETELGQLLVLNYGWSLPEKKRVAGEYPVYGSNGVVGYHNEALVEKAGIIVGRKGSGGRVHLSHSPFCPIDTTFYTTQNDTPLDLNFLYYLLLHIDLQKIVTGVGVPGLNREIAYREKTSYPESRDEQRRIAHVLTTVQTAIEQQARMIALTRELKSALMKKLFTEGLRGEKQKETEIGLVPEGWEELQLNKTGDVIYGIQAAVAKNIKPIGMKILTNKNITLDGQIVLDEINYFELKTKRHFDTILQKGDILFNWRSGSKEHIGKTAYFDVDGEYVHSSFILRIRPNQNVNGKYLFWYLYYLRAKGYFQQKHNVSSVNTTFNKSAVDAMPAFLPSKEEQDEIASILDTIDTKIGLLKKKHDRQEELFRTLLHQLMTGEVRTTDLHGLEDFADGDGADNQDKHRV